MKQDLFIGDRIQISTLGASRCPRLAGKTGTIVGRSIYANSVSVRLDGNKSKSTFHRDYLQVILSAAGPICDPERSSGPTLPQPDAVRAGRCARDPDGVDSHPRPFALLKWPPFIELSGHPSVKRARSPTPCRRRRTSSPNPA
jgi:hypothetical protein